MSETVLEPRVRGSIKKPEGTHPPQDPRLDTELLAAVESRVLREVEARLAALQQGTVEAAATLIAERVDALIELKVKKAISGTVLAGTDRMKDAVLKVMQGVLLESGLLERFIQRAVEAKVQGLSGGAGAAKDGPRPGAVAGADGDVRGLVQKEISRALAGEELKGLVDEKFRAITLYLKTDVIPKVVQQTLKADAKPPPAAAGA